MKNNRTCEICHVCFYEKPGRIAIGKGRFCSKSCFDKYQKGRIKNRSGVYKKCNTCAREFYVRKSKIHRRFCSKKCSIGNINYHTSDETKRKLSIINIERGHRPPSQKGKKFTKEHKSKLGLKGFKNPRWKGGITPENERIRNSAEYKSWRNEVFKRDNFQCVICGSGNKSGSRTPIHADHIKPFAYFPDLRLDINNGRTLCHSCHKKTDTYLNRWYKHKVNSL
jgi:HNH endonuclease